MKVKFIAALMALLIASLMAGTAVAQDNGVSWGSLSDGQREMLGQLQDNVALDHQSRVIEGNAVERLKGVAPS